MICGSGGSKSRLAKAAGAEPCCQMRHKKMHADVVRSTFESKKGKKKHAFGARLEVEMWKKCTPLWCEAHFRVKMYKTSQLRSTFRSCDVEKDVEKRSTFPSKNVQNKSKVYKTEGSPPLCDVQMSKTCTLTN